MKHLHLFTKLYISEENSTKEQFMTCLSLDIQICTAITTFFYLHVYMCSMITKSKALLKKDGYRHVYSYAMQYSPPDYRQAYLNTVQ